MIIDADTERPEQIRQFARRFNVRSAGRGIAAGMIVREHDSASVMSKGVADDLSERQDDLIMTSLCFTETNHAALSIKMGDNCMFMIMMQYKRCK